MDNNNCMRKPLTHLVVERHLAVVPAACVERGCDWLHALDVVLLGDVAEVKTAVEDLLEEGGREG
jgi:hypothetical protein